MSRTCDIERLERLAHGELPADEAAAVERHAQACEACADELAWLRAELAAMRERADAEEPLPASLWAGVEARIARAAPARRRPGRSWLAAIAAAWRGERARWFGFGVATAAGVAALMLVLLGRDPATTTAVAPSAPDAGAAPSAPGAHGDRMAEALRAIDAAERAHRDAIDTLEAAYRERRDQLDPAVAQRYDEQFRATRDMLADAREAAGDDINARMLLLDAYASHRRSVQEIVQGIEVSK